MDQIFAPSLTPSSQFRLYLGPQLSPQFGPLLAWPIVQPPARSPVLLPIWPPDQFRIAFIKLLTVLASLSEAVISCCPNTWTLLSFLTFYMYLFYYLTYLLSRLHHSPPRSSWDLSFMSLRVCVYGRTKWCWQKYINLPNSRFFSGLDEFQR